MEKEKMKVIAEYMEWKLFRKDGAWIPDSFLHQDVDLNGTTAVTWNRFKFNTSFDWLMPVCKKVLDELFELPRMKTEYTIMDIQRAMHTCDITPLFEATVKGIILLNNYKKQTT